MSAVAWLHGDLLRPVVAPYQSDASRRDALRLVLVVAQFHVELAPRYQRRDVTGDGAPETFCNFFVRDVSEAMGAPVPQVRANEQVQWLGSDAARARGWAAISEHAAQGCAAEGLFVVAGWYNRNGGSGHVAVVMPSLDEDGTFIAQAGLSNFTHGRLAQGFGPREVSFFAHP